MSEANHSNKNEDAFKFRPPQKVFCYHQDKLYLGRCQGNRVHNGKKQYFIHYHGWSKSWDEWVDETRLLEYNTENEKYHDDMVKKSVEELSTPKGQKRKLTSTPQVTKSEKIRTTHSVSGKESSGSSNVSTPGRKVSSDSVEKKPTVSTKRKSVKLNRSEITEKSITQSNLDVKISIPEELQQIIFDDNHYIMNLNMLVDVPNVKCVDDIIDCYIKFRTECDESVTARVSNDFNKDLKLTKDTILENLDYNVLGSNFHKNCYNEVANGIRVYFNTVLPTQLLYKFERVQYQELTQCTSTDDSEKTNDSSVTTRIAPSKLYGVHHLLRLFTILSRLLSYFDFDEGFLQMLTYFIGDFLDYLNRNREQYFSSNHYITATQDYIRRAL